MSAPTNATPRIPSAEARCPDCPVCGHETDAQEDEFICQACRLGWGMDRFWLEPGYRVDEVPQCGAEIQPYGGERFADTIAHFRYRCIRNEGHDSEHAGLRVDRDDAFDFAHMWANERSDSAAVGGAE